LDFHLEEKAMRQATALTILILLAAVLPLAGQSSAGSFGEAIDVRVVNVEAVVTDGHGERVRGLAAQDFRLLVDGREVPVEFFTEIVDGNVVTATTPAEGGMPAAGPAEPEVVGRSILVFVDDSFGVAAQRNVVLKRLEASLARLSPGDRIAVVAFDGTKLDLLSDWTADRSRLSTALAEARKRRAYGLRVKAHMHEIQRALGTATAIRGFTPEPVPTTAATFGRMEGETLGALSLESGGAGYLDLYTPLSRVVTAAAAAMRSLPAPQGRKVMLVLSGGWPLLEQVPATGLLDRGPVWMQSGMSEAVYRPLVDTANLLGYTLYPVDVPGLGSGGVDVEEADFISSRGVISSPWDQATEYALHFLARETGGEAAFNSARLDALDRMAADTSTYYWLGFTPAWQADDRHHRIELQVRRPGLRARTRNGFTDLSRQTELAMSTEGFLMLGGGGTQPERIRIETGAPRRTGLATLTLPVTLHIPADALTAAPAAGGYVLAANLSLGALDRWGARSDLPMVPLRMTVDKQPKPGDVVRYRTVLKMRRARQHVVFTLRDELSGEMVWGKLDYKP
jgi:VWFA-related protein